MNKTAIKNFAIWARRKLIADITYKAGMVGISENGIAQPLPQSTRDLQFFDIGTKNYAEVSGVAVEQRNALVNVIRDKEKGSDYKTAFQNVVEEVAYTWFNRLMAVRFMEVNDYLPSKVRVLSSESEGKLEPDFVTTPFETDLDFSPYERDLVLQLKDSNKLDELFRFLFIKQCNKLSEILPGLFEKISDYTELLLNISFTDKDGIVFHLTHDISEDEFNVEKEGQVEIIGWMYQYYNTEPKDEVFALLKKNVKITKERIPAATQLFTPDWIVRYMVENSLGRLWVEGHPNERLKENWKYYLEEAEQEPDVIEQLKKIREEHTQLNPTNIKVIDPCMGSGHILVYAFDVLMQIYVSQGYTERDAAKSILVNNLYGIDIDTRAYQLAYFAVMMKARQFNRKIFGEHITPNLIAIKNPENVSKSVLKRLGGLETVGLRLLEDFEDAEEYGSILQVNYTADELDRMEKKLEEIEQEAQYGNLLVQMEASECIRLVRPLIKQARLLAKKYEVVVTNPPYMGAKRMSSKLVNYTKTFYPNSKADMFSVFIERAMGMVSNHGYQAMITQHAWMFLDSFRQLRKLMLSKAIVNMAHLGTRAFEEIGGEVVQTTAFVLMNSQINNYVGNYKRLVQFLNQDDKEREFLSSRNMYCINQKDYSYIDDEQVAYWLGEKVLKLFDGSKIIDYADACYGFITGDNERYLKLWHEVDFFKINTLSNGKEEFDESGALYAPCNKGGAFRKWYGNNDYIALWKQASSFHRNGSTYQYAFFQKGITWSVLSSNMFNGRYYGNGYVFDHAAASLFVKKDDYLEYILGYLNSCVFDLLINALNPTINTGAEIVAKIPLVVSEEKKEKITDLVHECIDLCKEDWDSFETSWDFKMHPLLDVSQTWNQAGLSLASMRLSECYNKWEARCQKRFDQLKADELNMNRLFIDIYGLHGELSPEVDAKNISVRKADLGRDVRSFISYAVGCMFGRYSLDDPGLVYAGGKWDNSRYTSFLPDKDNCIPITDTDYFQDDVVGRFVSFVRVAFGEELLEENLQFIAAALGNRGNTSRETIRNYFINDFYKDHLKVYQKRPIYWLFDSGKQNGFKALVYMHRWNADTVGNIRAEYLHKMQMIYERELESCQDMIDHGSSHEIAVAARRREKLARQIKECKDYDVLVAHIALSRVEIDLDDGVKTNYRKAQTGVDGKFCEILAESKGIVAKE